MVYWNYVISWGRYSNIASRFLSGEGNYHEQCATYCLNFNGCNGIAVTRFRSSQGAAPIYSCYINSAPYTSGPFCWGTNCHNKADQRQTIVFGVFKDYYDSNPQFLPTDAPDGTIAASYYGHEELCKEIPTGFGHVFYQNTPGYEYSAERNTNIVRESGTHCAHRCFEKAGCTAFYEIYNGCTFIIGASIAGKVNNAITSSGSIDDICPNTIAFTNSFTKTSRFYFLMYDDSEAGNVANKIAAYNTGNPNTRLRRWNFKMDMQIPMRTSSQYVSVDMPDVLYGYTGTWNSPWRPVYFKVQTHFRITVDDDYRRKRRSDESDLVPVGEFTIADNEKIAKQAAKEAEKAAKQRQIMPRTDDILAEIDAIEARAISFIQGELELPDEVELAATGPVETLEFIQTAADGSVTADCASGSCICSTGFINNGNGCEEMTPEQAETTTKAPTTIASTTTQAQMTIEASETSSNSVQDLIPSLMAKVQAVFKHNRPGKPRTHLIKKWKKLGDQFVQRYKTVASHGCNFADTYEDKTIDFDTVDTCKVSFMICAVRF